MINMKRSRKLDISFSKKLFLIFKLIVFLSLSLLSLHCQSSSDIFILLFYTNRMNILIYGRKNARRRRRRRIGENVCKMSIICFLSFYRSLQQMKESLLFISCNTIEKRKKKKEKERTIVEVRKMRQRNYCITFTILKLILF